jgi:lauroyl/myristoyl acyltransferase
MSISQFFQLQFNVYLARNLPLLALRAYMYLWGLIYMVIKIQMCANIAVCLSIMKNGRNIPRPFLLNLARAIGGIFEHYLEKLVMAHRPLEETTRYLQEKLTITNRHMLDVLARQGKGAILVTGHFGAVEYLPLAMAMNGYKISMICRFKTRTLKRALTEKAKKFGVQLIDAEEPRVAFRALKAIKDGRFLITECDEFSEWRFHKNQKVDVFGRIMPRDRTLDFFFKKARVPAFMTLVQRHGDRFRLSVDFLADGRESTSVSACAWAKLEEYISKYPFQWYQIKGASKFILEHSIEADRVDSRAGQDIPGTDSVLSPSFS